MKSKVWLLPTLIAGSALWAACGSEPASVTSPEPEPEVTAEPLRAVAQLAPTEGNSVSGTVTFEQTNGTVKVTAHVSGLSAGKHGFHIHENGDCSAPDGTSAGGHFNPSGVDHGGPTSPVHHVGDLGNLESDEGGNAHLEMEVDFISLQQGSGLIVARAVIVHAGEDDLASQPTGAAGARQACGVIELQ